MVPHVEGHEEGARRVVARVLAEGAAGAVVAAADGHDHAFDRLRGARGIEAGREERDEGAGALLTVGEDGVVARGASSP